VRAGEEGELKKLEQTPIDKRIFICVREGKVMASDSEGGSSTDVAYIFTQYRHLQQ